jgi:hypothetical protein
MSKVRNRASDQRSGGRGMTLTPRGWFVVFVSVIVFAIVVNILLRDFCWEGPCVWEKP